MAVDEGVGDEGWDGESVVGGPAAFGVLGGIGDEMGGVGVEDDEVGVVAFADEATAVDVVDEGRIVAHEGDDVGDGEQTLVGEVHHDVERMLDGRETGLGGEVMVGEFFVDEMWRMVGGDGVDETRAQGMEECRTVVGRLDGRVALDAIALVGIVVGREIEIVRTGLGRDLLAVERQVCLQE